MDLSYSASGNILTKTMDATTELSGITSALLYNNSYSYSERPHNVTSVNDVDYSWDYNGNLISRFDNNSSALRLLCWDEENRLAALRNIGGSTPDGLSVYIYNAGGDRVWKLSGEDQQMLINGQYWVNMLTFDLTLWDVVYLTYKLWKGYLKL